MATARPHARTHACTLLGSTPMDGPSIELAPEQEPKWENKAHLEIFLIFFFDFLPPISMSLIKSTTRHE